MTNVAVTRFVNCPFSAVIDFAEEALRSRGDISLSPAPLISQQATMTSRVTEDVSDPARRHDALLIAWRPKNSLLFPEFRGAFTVRPERRGAWLRIQGSYEPPFGFFGKIFDALIGRIIARRTLARMLGEVASNIEWRWHSFRNEITI